MTDNMTHDLDTIQAALELKIPQAIHFLEIGLPAESLDILKELLPTITLVKKMRDGGWQDINTAPKDGTPILMHGVMPWPVLAVWNAHHDQWAYANLQVEPVDGVWDDYYFETDSIHPENNDLQWQPLPKSPLKKPQPPASGGDDE